LHDGHRTDQEKQDLRYTSYVINQLRNHLISIRFKYNVDRPDYNSCKKSNCRFINLDFALKGYQSIASDKTDQNNRIHSYI